MDDFVRHTLPPVIRVEKIITVFYMEFSKDFHYDGETHDFWEMVYIDKGEMLCTADKNQFVLRAGELTFHKPNEFHNLSGNRTVPPNVSIITFECRSAAMKHFEGKILRPDDEERALLSMLFAEGLSCFRLVDPQNPLLQRLEKIPDAPFGSIQMTKNLLEIFLIRLHRHRDMLSKKSRADHPGRINLPADVQEILDIMEARTYEKLTVGDIARAVGKSESTVKNLFARYRSGGIMRYFTARKISEAKRLIREGRYNLAQIAEKLGFDTPQYFSKCFKDHAHMTPSEYRRSILR